MCKRLSVSCSRHSHLWCVVQQAIDSSDPLQLLTHIQMMVRKMSLQLTDANGMIAMTSARMLGLSLQTFKVMRVAQCMIEAAGVATPEHDVIKTGALSESEANFLHVEYKMQPHDTDVDHAVKVRMAPAYVTYDLAIVERVQAFAQVSGDEALDLSALGVQAATRLQEMQVRMSGAW